MNAAIPSKTPAESMAIAQTHPPAPRHTHCSLSPTRAHPNLGISGDQPSARRNLSTFRARRLMLRWMRLWRTSFEDATCAAASEGVTRAGLTCVCWTRGACHHCVGRGLGRNHPRAAAWGALMPLAMLYRLHANAPSLVSGSETNIAGYPRDYAIGPMGARLADEPGLVLHPLSSARLACTPKKMVAGSVMSIPGTKNILGFSIGPQSPCISACPTTLKTLRVVLVFNWGSSEP